MGKLKKTVLGIGIFVILFFMIGITNAFVNPMTAEEIDAYNELEKISETDGAVDCEFLSYQVDAYKETLELSALVGDTDSIIEWADLSKKYKKHCT